MEKNSKEPFQKFTGPEDQSSVERFRALFDYATIGIVVTDSNGSIINFNKYAEIQFGYSANEILGSPVEILLPQSIHAKHETFRKGFHQQHPQNRAMGIDRDLYARKKDGNEFPVEVSLSHYRLNEELHVIACVIDITVRKKNENQVSEQKKELEQITAEIQKINASLEQKVQERTMMLKETLAELEKSRKELKDALNKEKELGDLKSRFVTMASHEFRTPLSTILTSISLIGKYTTTEEQDKRDKHVSRVKEAVSNMRTILEDFLSLGKLEEGKIETIVSQFDLKDFTEEIIDENKSLSKSGQRFIYNHSGTGIVEVDKSHLKNIMTNLLSNAIKFSPENSMVTIKTEVSDTKIQIAVTDEGIGIPEDDLKHLFEPFFRTKNAQFIQGTGLGLHIIVRYLDLMNGTINCISKLGKGTQFIIEFNK